MNKKNEAINSIYETLAIVFNEEAMIGPRKGNPLLSILPGMFQIINFLLSGEKI